jgi:hypothetical protein
VWLAGPPGVLAARSALAAIPPYRNAPLRGLTFRANLLTDRGNVGRGAGGARSTSTRRGSDGWSPVMLRVVGDVNILRQGKLASRVSPRRLARRTTPCRPYGFASPARIDLAEDFRLLRAADPVPLPCVSWLARKQRPVHDLHLVGADDVSVEPLAFPERHHVARSGVLCARPSCRHSHPWSTGSSDEESLSGRQRFIGRIAYARREE